MIHRAFIAEITGTYGSYFLIGLDILIVAIERFTEQLFHR